ncbi:MAG: sterol desaturase [Gammaproteobacteria bacterium RIFCSPHIGHO2_12_FULL_63_22]|nr:MAG: sterol desaturase [Gammaproteobacteria bacterium RIFCSPHIGHO2_12_FULL_63_22]
MISSAIRFAAYPVVVGASVAAILPIAAGELPPWPGYALVAALGMASVAILERLRPYQQAWLHDHGDLATDIVHTVVNLGLLSATALGLHALRLDLPSVWPHHWPLWIQMLLAGAVIDLGLYAMHRLSHRVDWLWRLHATHHSSERLYWLNGERRHPLSALLLGAPGIVTAVGLGAPPAVISAWLTLLTVHLAFQHANLDYRLGPLRYLLGVGEIHRWHHKREFEDAQVNFGEFWMFWDHLFGTFHDRSNGVQAADVGLREAGFPQRYVDQLRWPFRRPASSVPSSASTRIADR